MSTILDDLMKANEYPIVFIGSGMPKRFLQGFPDWATLLEEFWNQIKQTNFYGELNLIRDSIEKKNPSYSEKEIEHHAYIEMGSKLEECFNEAFNSEKIRIDGFNPRKAFKSKISPFKKAIAKKFETYSYKEGIEEELTAFKRMLSKTQIILTTNYDRFIENSYNEYAAGNITKYIGQKGFFQDTYGNAELFKLHGCVESPADIIITKKDYENFDRNSVLISAKIISMMMHSPIIFLGYSLTDINVRNIIKDFTRSLTDNEMQILENRLILIERKENEKYLIEEMVNDRDLGCKLRVIKTDNYKLVFDKISSINQGVAPVVIRKYQQVFKKIVIDRGKKGSLNSVLISPETIDDLEANLRTKNIVIAFGDGKYIFQIPDIVSYCLDYISDKDEISNDIRMRFAVYQNGNARFPINKILDKTLIEESSLHPSEKLKLLQKTEWYSSFERHYKSINQSSVFNKNLSDINKIIEGDTKKSKIYETLSYNIKSLDLNALKKFLISELEELKEKGEIRIITELRRLLLLYDILKYKRSNA